MIYLHPHMRVKTACYLLRISGLRLRWNIQQRALEIVEL